MTACGAPGGGSARPPTSRAPQVELVRAAPPLKGRHSILSQLPSAGAGSSNVSDTSSAASVRRAVLKRGDTDRRYSTSAASHSLRGSCPSLTSPAGHELGRALRGLRRLPRDRRLPRADRLAGEPQV